MKKFIFAVFILTVTLHFNHYSQGTFHIVGNDNLQNTNNNYPSIYGNYYRGVKNQFIIRASEMQAAGMSAGPIIGLGFNVVSTSGATLDDFEIQIKTTTQNSITSWDNNNLTTCFGPVDYNDQTGWNQHTFNNPFQWDGSSNIMIRTCFYNNTWADNAVMKMSNYTYNTLIYRRRNNNPCTSNWINGVESKRPNIRFQWLDPNTPPVSNFSSNSSSSCTGTVSFYDQSTTNTTSWLWDFGDGNTSSSQNPTHTYTQSGSYDVQLISSNSYGTDTSYYPNFVQVFLAGYSPIPANCIPNTQVTTSGFGISEVKFGNLHQFSGNSSEGYSEFTCDTVLFYIGKSYDFLAVHSTPAPHNCAAWIDYNNDGNFNDITEKIISSSNGDSTHGTIQIPNNATLNQPIRMRVVADFSLLGPVSACSDPQYGQAEDYSLYFAQDTSPPEANFSSDRTLTCSGFVGFSDLSTNAPYAWYWDFGDGNTSIMQNPTHTYINSGEFDVTLISTNAYGSDTIYSPNHIEVDTAFNVITPSCTPSTLGYCCDYGINRVQFANINHPSADAIEGYSDFSCEQRAYVEAGNNYILTVETGSSNPQDTRAWIDFNNDGVFDNNEKVMEKLNDFNPISVVQIPSTNVIYNTSFRLRISSDEVGSNNGPCDNLFRGQVEDYGIFVSTCPDPNNASIGQISKNTVQVYWNPGGSESSWNIAYGQVGFNVQSGAGNRINNIFVNNYFIVGLNESTNYDFYIQANCDNQTSSWIGPLNATTLNINESSLNILSLYPNPNNGHFDISSKIPLKTITVFNLLGEEVFDKDILRNKFNINIDLSTKPKGIYFVEVLDVLDNSKTFKVIFSK